MQPTNKDSGKQSQSFSSNLHQHNSPSTSSGIRLLITNDNPNLHDVYNYIVKAFDNVIDNLKKATSDNNADVRSDNKKQKRDKLQLVENHFHSDSSDKFREWSAIFVKDCAKNEDGNYIHHHLNMIIRLRSDLIWEILKAKN